MTQLHNLPVYEEIFGYNRTRCLKKKDIVWHIDTVNPSCPLAFSTFPLPFAIIVCFFLVCVVHLKP